MTTHYRHAGPVMSDARELIRLLDEDTGRAVEIVHTLVADLVNVSPPRPIQQFRGDDRREFVHDVLVHLTKENFRVLRQARECRGPLEAWLFVVVRNFAIDTIRHDQRVGSVIRSVDPSVIDDLHAAADTPEGAARRLAYRRLLEQVRHSLAQLGQYCRLLLEMAADEFTPLEMTTVLAWSPERAKKVSDDLRYCRRKLKRSLEKDGIDLKAVLSPDGRQTDDGKKQNV